MLVVVVILAYAEDGQTISLVDGSVYVILRVDYLGAGNLLGATVRDSSVATGEKEEEAPPWRGLLEAMVVSVTHVATFTMIVAIAKFYNEGCGVHEQLRDIHNAESGKSRFHGDFLCFD
ncbi:uncharacterized protein G2W53_013930 [Senna tora]|uniref:Uncharacterized protein n=1 Tax=Senna tora TaxID=362788 RepID=A0A834U1D3_9FABA|nr:uncharacterized protein G2W53_013930 [Senna tora]